MHIRVRVPSEEHHPTCCILSPRPAFLNGRGACESTTASCPSLNNDNANAPRGPSRRCKASLIQPRRVACSVAVRRRKYYSAPRVQRAKDARFLRRRGRNLLPLPTLFDPRAGFLSNAPRGPAETARGPTLSVSIGSLPSILVPSLSVPARATGKNSNALPMPCHALPRPATPCHARAGPRQLPHPAALPREGREPRPHKARLLRKDW